MTTIQPDPPYPQAFERIGPANARTPLVLAVPHAGRDYPAAVLRQAAVSRSVLERLEDRHADALVTQAVTYGGVAIVARVARATIDLNRGEDDLDPILRDPPGSGPPPSARCRSGLGLVPLRSGGRPLWRAPPDTATVATRIALIHRPYHEAIAAALEQAMVRHGFAVLIDCHSMPSLGGGRPARVVIGDLHGASAAPAVSMAALAAVRNLGMIGAMNAPYAGAFSIARHGRPIRGIHALQLEIDRSLYLRADLRTPSAAIDFAAALVNSIAWAAVNAAMGTTALAAE